MSAALQLPMLCAAGTLEPIWPAAEAHDDEAGCCASPSINQNESLAFYRGHTERMLRRYLYASMQIGRSPSILSEPLGRGWASSCRVKTFEDAVIFVMDIEHCINHLSSLDRELLSKIVIQEYTQVEAANLLGMSVRAVGYKFPEALDHLTEFLLASHLLILSD